MRDQRLLGSPPVDAIGQIKREHIEVSLVVVRNHCSHASKLRVLTHDMQVSAQLWVESSAAYVRDRAALHMEPDVEPRSTWLNLTIPDRDDA